MKRVVHNVGDGRLSLRELAWLWGFSTIVLVPVLAGIVWVASDPYSRGAVGGLLVTAAIAIALPWAVCTLSLITTAIVRSRTPPGWCCQKCGYDRRGLKWDAACPECGRLSRD